MIVGGCVTGDDGRNAEERSLGSCGEERGGTFSEEKIFSSGKNAKERAALLLFFLLPQQPTSDSMGRRMTGTTQTPGTGNLHDTHTTTALAPRLSVGRRRRPAPSTAWLRDAEDSNDRAPLSLSQFDAAEPDGGGVVVLDWSFKRLGSVVMGVRLDLHSLKCDSCDGATMLDEVMY